MLIIKLKTAILIVSVILIVKTPLSLLCHGGVHSTCGEVPL